MLTATRVTRSRGKRKAAIAAEALEFVKRHIDEFHKARIESLRKLRLEKILIRKNPYLFRAKNILTSEEFVRALLDAHISSQEEAMFGNFLERLALAIAKKAYQGRKSSTEGIDLEFERNGTKYIVAIKSGPNWGNSSSIKKMEDHFRRAKRVLQTSTVRGGRINLLAINGCCYGKEYKNNGDYIKYCGQMFWELISGDPDLFTDIIEPLGYRAREKNEEFANKYAAVVNIFTQEFTDKYCLKGLINWKKIVAFNSAKPKK